MQGATGNIDPRSRGNFAVAEENGRAMGRAALEAISRAPSLADAGIEVLRFAMKLELKIPRRCRTRKCAGLCRADRGFAAQPSRRRRLSVKAPARSSCAISLRARAALEVDRGAEPPRSARRYSASRTVDVDDDCHCREYRTDRNPRRAIRRARSRAQARSSLRPYLRSGLLQRSDRIHSHSRGYEEGGYEVDTSRIAPGSGETIVESRPLRFCRDAFLNA